MTTDESHVLGRRAKSEIYHFFLLGGLEGVVEMKEGDEYLKML
jgi:hypothetical protein